MIVNYSGSSPANTIRQYIQNGRGSGNSGGFNDVETWNGTGGIMSSTARDVSPSQFGNFSVGYTEASDYGGLGSYTSFGGQTVSTSAILVKYTRSGDTNLDGVVNIADAQALSNNIFANDSRWSYGDMDYDGSVDLDDAQALSNNFDINATPLSQAQVTAQFGAAFASAWQAGQAEAAARAAAVPEPASLSILGIGAMALLKRRRRN